MLAEIGNFTGKYIPGISDESRYMPGISDETGKDNRLLFQEQPDQIRELLPYRLLSETTGADIYESRAFLHIIGTTVASHNSITLTSFRIKVPEGLSRAASRPSLPEITNLASSLCESSGLDAGTLADILHVSHKTYQRWLRGSPPGKKHRNRMLEVLPLLQEAKQRLRSSEAVSTWLRTPVSSEGKQPLEYLVEKRYGLFRGFLLHQHTGHEYFRPLQPSRRTFKPRTREEVEDVREQLRPHTWYDEEDDPDTSNE